MKKLALVLLLPLFSGCIHRMRTWHGYLKPYALSNIALGMPKDQIITEIGFPDIVRGSLTNEQGQIVEVWEYVVIRDEMRPLPYSEVYWLYLHDNKLAKWCKAGDWETAQHEIKEIRFR